MCVLDSDGNVENDCGSEDCASSSSFDLKSVHDIAAQRAQGERGNN